MQLVINIVEDRSPAPNAYTVFLGDRTAVQHSRQLVVSPEDASGGSDHDWYTSAPHAR